MFSVDVCIYQVYLISLFSSMCVFGIYRVLAFSFGYFFLFVSRLDKSVC